MGSSGKTHSITPVFIGGTGRSGTTVLGDLLNEHSLVRTSNPTEIKFLANRGGFLDVVFGSMNSQLENREKISIFHYRTYRQRAKKDLLQRRVRFDEFSEKLWQKWWEIDAPAPHGPGLHAGIDKKDLQSLLGTYAKSIKKDSIKQARKLIQGFIGTQKNRKGENEYKESYNTISAADLHNEMTDDIKIILREYRLALKKNKNERKDAFRDNIKENIEKQK